ncbi:MAG: potassium channel family protein [Desulfonatronovibrio sp.]
MKHPLVFTKKFLAVFSQILVMTTPVWGVLALAIVGCSWFISIVEHIRFGDALYFALVTALTIGYGDIYPLSAAGKTVSVFIGILGVITTGIIVAAALQAIRITYDQVIADAMGRFRKDRD